MHNQTSQKDMLNVERLQVYKLHGMRHDGLSVDDLSTGINVIYGENASGKSTLARGLQALLWPSLVREARPGIEGLFQLDGSQWRVSLDGSHVGYQQDGVAASRPPLASADQHDRYALALHDLLNATNDKLAKAILEAAAGGYDVDAARKELGFSAVNPVSNQTTDRVDEAYAALQEARSEERKVWSFREEIEDLEEEHRAARDARSRLEAHRKAKEAISCRTAMEEAQAALETYPDVLSRMEGRENERVGTHQEELDEAEAEVVEAEKAIAAAEKALDDCRIPSSGLPEGLIQTVSSTVESLRDAEIRAERAEESRTSAEKKRQDEWARVKGGIDEEKARSIDLPSVQKVASFAQSAESVRAKRKALAELDRLLGDTNRPTSNDDVEEGLRLLRKWLATASQRDIEGPSMATYLVLAGGIATGLGGIWVAYNFDPLGWALVVVAALLIAASFWLMRRSTPAGEQSVYQRDYRQLSQLPEPSSWTVNEVRSRVRDLEKRYDKARLQKLKVTAWKRHDEDRKSTQQAAQTLRETGQELADRFGIELARAGSTHEGERAADERASAGRADDKGQGENQPHAAGLSSATEKGASAESLHNVDENHQGEDPLGEDPLGEDPLGEDPLGEAHLGSGQLSEATLYSLVEGVRRWQDADAEEKGHAAACDAAKQHAHDHLEAINTKLKAYGLGGAEDSSAAKGNVETLRAAKSAFDDATQQLEHARSTLEKAKARKRKAEAKVNQIYEELGLKPGDSAGLSRLLEQLDDYEDAREALNEAEIKFEQTRRELEQHRAHEEGLLDKVDLLSASEAELEGAIADLEAQAERMEEISNDIARKKDRIERATQRHDVEEAQARYRQSLDALDAERQDDFQDTAGMCMADYIHRQTRDQALPEVFHEARDLFRTITHGRYRLDFDHGDASFTAYDTKKQQGLALDELSSGTRVQLLLAVRVAFVSMQEQGAALPLVLDETLANSDDKKARAIINAIQEISAAGRQVFYLTAQDDEVSKWMALQEDTDVAHRFVTLDEKPDERPVSESIITPSTSLGESVPSPKGMDHEQYGEALGVPIWTPRSMPGELHLWYLVDDVELLHDTLQWGLSYWGPFRELILLGSADVAGVSEASAMRIQALARAVEAWQEAWHIGRGRPVERAALEATDAVTDNFIDEVSGLREARDGDAEAILQALREGAVKGFRENKKDDLEAFFEERGHIDRSPPLSEAELRARVLSAIGDELRAGVVRREAVWAVFDRIERQSYGSSRQAETSKVQTP